MQLFPFKTPIYRRRPTCFFTHQTAPPYHPTPTLKACNNFSPAYSFSLSRQPLVGEIKYTMDRTDYHNQEGLTHLIMSSQSLKKVTQLLLSVSVFSFVLSHSTWYSLFLHFFKIHFSSFSSLVLSYTMDKNCIFLICNGILVVLAKTAGTSFSPSTSDHQLDERLFNNNGDDHEDGLQSVLDIDSLPAKETTDHEPLENVVVEEKEEEEEEKEKEDKDDSNSIVEYKEEEGQNGLLTRVGEEEEEEEGGGGGGLQSTTEDDEEDENELGTIGFINEDYEEEEENRLLSTEELNKKFDDFIRRMKEEIRIGAQQQLVMVQ